jgi:hypothetical protein
MSTNSTITVKVNNTYRTIYCHWDGYLEWNGKLLVSHYNTQELAERVVSLGDLSTLDRSLDCPDDHTFDEPVKGHTIAFGRDRNEQDVDARTYDTYEDAMKREKTCYNYLWDGEQWLVDGEPLAEELFLEQI